ncbi:MAG TPA: sterol desaturase family protein [Burkholderiales bacterium]|jgi:sterol desaturase/sphingolipid hydroxylase (fatty acid hydroxylase superfamily)|nr:sterol desaturase family protein [Burkholderiales bacterium]
MSPEARAAIGKRAGLSSGLLGMLCVLGELCFLLPDLLVSKEALPVYAANIEHVRAILGASIAVTIVLGVLAVALTRPNRRGLLGIALGATALLMGGPGAEALAVGGPRSFSVGLDYFVLELLVLGLIFMPIEALFPLRAQRVLRAGWETDLKHFFVSHAGVQLLSFAALIPAQVLFAWAVQLDFQRAVAAQPIWLQVVEIIVVVDFATYWIHRAFHQVPWLWNFHAIHHSSLQMDWLAGSRMHPVDVVVTRSVAILPVFVLGFAPPAFYAYLAIVSFHAVFIHANVRWHFPYLRWIVTTPEYHHWHHSSDEEGIDKNFVSFLPAWDVLFGTAHQPDYWPKRYGTVNFQPPETYLGQLFYPFRRRGKVTPYG